MHNNYYFLRQLSKELKSTIVGFELVECFSQMKNELILAFLDGQTEFFIKAHLQPDFSCLSFPHSFSRANKNTANIFEELIRKRITDVIQFKNERGFSLVFDEGFELVFKMFGNRANLILFKDRENIKIFKNSLVQDKQLKHESLHRNINQDFQTFRENDANYKAIFPTFGKEVQEYLQSKNYDNIPIEEQWKLLSDVLAQLEDSRDFYITKVNAKPSLSLLNLGKIDFHTNDPIEAINHFFKLYTRDYYLEREKQVIEKQLEQIYNKTISYIKKSESKLVEIQLGLGYDKIADIIMANLHQIPPRAATVELFNFYSNEQIKIKLNKALSPQKNAENFYRKSKNQKIEIENLQKNIQSKNERRLSLKRHLEAVSQITGLKELRKYLKDHSLSKSNEDEGKSLPFKTFEIDGWQILVGKNAKSNDQLTQKFAYKEDLWLHAKDVSGSHVLIKYQSGQKFPNWIIEKAAQLAAYYSQRKSDTFCPVIVTPKKFVRKPKGAAPGAVFIDKEEVIMVKPAPYNEL